MLPRGGPTVGFGGGAEAAVLPSSDARTTKVDRLVLTPKFIVRTEGKTNETRTPRT